MKKIRNMLIKIAQGGSKLAGNPQALGLAMVLILLWALAGPLMSFSETWQLLINTATTIITLLLALSIQYTQNRDARAIHLKLNKLIAQYEDLQESLEQIEKELDDD